jgi:hypothetical protein
MSDLRHIHDPVLSSLKMEGIRFFFLLFLMLHTIHAAVQYAHTSPPTSCIVFSFLAASPGTIGYAFLSWTFQTNLSADKLTVSQTHFFMIRLFLTQPGRTSV